MNDLKVVLVTGVNSYWGAEVARKLHADAAVHVIGLGESAPYSEIEGLDFVDARVTNPLLAEFLMEEGVSSICHLESVGDTAVKHTGNSSYRSGTRMILDAGVKTGVEKFVFMSSTAVYGAHPDNPVFITEEMPLRGESGSAHISELLEVESVVESIAESNPELSVSVLRFANIIGPSTVTPFTRYLKQAAPLKLIGFDPAIQMIHESDVVEALARATVSDTTGSFNIAAGGVMPLSRILRILRKVPTLVFPALASRRFSRWSKRRCGSDKIPLGGWNFLRYSLVAETTKMSEELGFTPTVDLIEALREFSGRPATVEMDPGDEGVTDAVSNMKQIIEDRKRRREQA